MKKQTFLIVLTVLIFTVLIFSACGKTGNVGTVQPTDNNASNANQKPVTNSTPANIGAKDVTGNECRICDFDYASYKGDLKKEEIEGLLLALNDEYHALAVYDEVNKNFGDPRPFINIRQAEEKHAARLQELFKTYQIPIPENPWPGNVARFSSVAEACRAGVDAEIANRDLYQNLFKSTDREDILTVYRALKAASEDNHLPAFERCGAGGGGPKRGNK
ncbi:MAG: hypothetical protein R2747_15400 [Pyrinomonadaceae bacterium]